MVIIYQYINILWYQYININMVRIHIQRIHLQVHIISTFMNGTGCSTSTEPHMGKVEIEWNRETWTRYTQRKVIELTL